LQPLCVIGNLLGVMLRAMVISPILSFAAGAASQRAGIQRRTNQVRV
jgi:hypothetical protein